MPTASTPRFDGWIDHPAAFSFRALEMATQAAMIPLGGLAADPFLGSGRAGTFITGRGDRFFGMEAHPLLAELSALKMGRPGPPADLRLASTELIARAEHRLPRVNLNSEQNLVQKFVAPETLRELVALRDCAAQSDGEWRSHLRWIVLATLRDIAGKSWPYARERQIPGRSPLRLAELRTQRMADDLASAPRVPQAKIVCGDARTASGWQSIASESVGACVSSPPYLNQVSYVEVTRLELHFLGLARTWGEMSSFGRGMVAACTQQVNASRAAEANVVLEQYPATDALVRTLSRRLKRVRLDRGGRKYYELLMPAYFADMAEVLTHLRRVLAPGARAAWVVGDSAPYDVRVDTPYLLGVLAEDAGFQVLEEIHLRERGSKWQGVGGRADRKLSERLLVFRRPPRSQQEMLPGFPA